MLNQSVESYFYVLFSQVFLCKHKNGWKVGFSTWRSKLWRSFEWQEEEICQKRLERTESDQTPALCQCYFKVETSSPFHLRPTLQIRCMFKELNFFLNRKEEIPQNEACKPPKVTSAFDSVDLTLAFVFVCTICS